MKIAVEGCAHGELDNIYNTIKCLEKKENFKVDLLICCGDFQSSRNYDDLCCMAMPPKYYNICSFYKYYNGEKVAPVLTIFIGGNHEASNYLQELPYGGWVAPNIYYLGYAGVINIGGIRIGGISGIFKSRDYMKGHYEYSPYDDNTKRSVYHIRNLEIFRLKQLSGPLNIFLSHDWPQGVTDYGNKAQLVRYKPYFEEDINNGALGSVPLKDLLNKLKPEYWFAAHLHCKFAAIIPHDDGKKTKFLALDKCLPTKRFLQIIDIPHNIDSKIEINYDLEWLTILRTTNHLLSVKNVNNYLPGPGSQEKWSFTPTEEEKSITLSKFGNNLVVPNNFKKTAKGVVQNTPKNVKQPMAMCNPQTVLFCQKLSVDDPLNLILNLHTEITETSFDSNTDESDVSVTNPLQRKITALSLPEPERDDVNLPLIEENCEDTPKLWEIDQTEAEMSNSDVVENVSNKFKRRRNAALYSFNS